MNIVFEKKFKKQYKKLDRKMQEKFIERLKIFEADEMDPSLNNHKLASPFKNCRSINISGDFRAIYYKKESTAYFITIGTHSQLYS